MLRCPTLVLNLRILKLAAARPLSISLGNLKFSRNLSKYEPSVTPILLGSTKVAKVNGLFLKASYYSIPRRSLIQCALAMLKARLSRSRNLINLSDIAFALPLKRFIYKSIYLELNLF